MVSLFDVNTLVALAWPSHVHHEVAQRWFRAHARAGWATCPLTHSSFVRVSSNTKILPDAKSPREAIDLLRRIVAQPHHVFWSDDFSIAGTQWVAVDRLTGYRQVTDAHLLGLALKRGGRLVTLDRGVRDLIPAGFDKFRVTVLVG